MNVQNSPQVSNCAHGSFYTVKFKHSTPLIGSGLAGEVIYSIYIVISVLSLS